MKAYRNKTSGEFKLLDERDAASVAEAEAQGFEPYTPAKGSMLPAPYSAPPLQKWQIGNWNDPYR